VHPPTIFILRDFPSPLQTFQNGSYFTGPCTPRRGHLLVSSFFIGKLFYYYFLFECVPLSFFSGLCLFFFPKLWTVAKDVIGKTSETATWFSPLTAPLFNSIRLSLFTVLKRKSLRGCNYADQGNFTWVGQDSPSTSFTPPLPVSDWIPLNLLNNFLGQGHQSKFQRRSFFDPCQSPFRRLDWWFSVSREEDPGVVPRY